MYDGLNAVLRCFSNKLFEQSKHIFYLWSSKNFVTSIFDSVDEAFTCAYFFILIFSHHQFTAYSLYIFQYKSTFSFEQINR